METENTQVRNSQQAKIIFWTTSARIAITKSFVPYWLAYRKSTKRLMQGN